MFVECERFAVLRLRHDRTYTQLPVRGDGGSGLPGDPSPTSNSNDTRFPEKNQVKITTLFKISDPSIEMYDILKPHWQITLAVPRFGSLLNSPNHLYLRMPRHIVVPKIKKSATFFYRLFAVF